MVNTRSLFVSNSSNDSPGKIGFGNQVYLGLFLPDTENVFLGESHSRTHHQDSFTLNHSHPERYRMFDFFEV